jgi:hypothetical protein
MSSLNGGALPSSSVVGLEETKSAPHVTTGHPSVLRSRWLFTRTLSVKLGAGIYNDIRSRAPYYISDWTDAWSYRVVPATVLIFFAKYAFFFKL